VKDIRNRKNSNTEIQTERSSSDRRSSARPGTGMSMLMSMMLICMVVVVISVDIPADALLKSRCFREFVHIIHFACERSLLKVV